jgi:hypothetical protein
MEVPDLGSPETIVMKFLVAFVISFSSRAAALHHLNCPHLAVAP